MAGPRGGPPITISQPKLLLVEGKDELCFFRAMLKHLGVDDVQTLEVGGVRNFAIKVPAVAITPGFDSVKALGIVRDADADAAAALQSVAGVLRAVKLPAPARVCEFTATTPCVGVYLMPGSEDAGMLEDLCLRTVADHPLMQCVDGFIECVGGAAKLKPVGTPREDGEAYYPNVISKARAKAFLAGQENDLTSVGVAAEAGLWDFEHPAISDLAKFLRELAA